MKSTTEDTRSIQDQAADSPWTPEPTQEVLDEIASWVVHGADPKPHGSGCWREHPECMLSILFVAYDRMFEAGR